jgi:hypothetical protein
MVLSDLSVPAYFKAMLIGGGESRRMVPRAWRTPD